MLGQFGLEPSDHNTNSYLHTFAEVSKQTGRVTRDYAADPEIAETPLDLLLSKGFLAEQAAAIDPNQASPNAPFGQFGQSPPCIPQSYTSTYAPSSPSTPNVQNAQSHTTHFVVADREGNVVSSTQTLGNVFGSKLMPEGTGVWLNDQLAWSRFEPAGNVFDVFPGRQSLYALCPTIVLRDGRPSVALGTPGGRTIPQTTAQMLINLTSFDMDIQQAVSAPRFSFVIPELLGVEGGIPAFVRGELEALGHDVYVDEYGFGNAHALTVEYGRGDEPVRFTGGADPRGEGTAAGY
jgi:gamma-glutamyltranspeptidase/glutathione hydrolase